MFSSRRGGFGAVVVAALVFAGACSPGGSHRRGNAVGVSLRNFAIDVPSVVRAGKTSFEITGRGPTMHEFNVVRTTLGAKNLPVDAAGLVDDENPHPNFQHLAEAEGIDIGDHKSLTVDLTPGTYAVYCNMDGHYQSGMASQFVVKP